MDFIRNNISGIYSIINLINGKCYIGSSINLKNRKYNHFYHLRKNNHINKKLQNSFDKHGEENFSFELVEILENKDNLIKTEQKWVDFFKPEYNICNQVVNSRLGIKASDETKRKMSISFKGRVISESALINMRIASQKLKGIPRSENVKLKISISNKGKIRTDEQRKMASIQNKGKKVSKETIDKIMITRSLNPEKYKGYKFSEEKCLKMSLSRKGRRLTQECKEKISNALKGRIVSEETKIKTAIYNKINGYPTSRKVENTETKIIYQSIKSAWESFDRKLTLASFGRKIRGKQKLDIPFKYVTFENEKYAQIK